MKKVLLTATLLTTLALPALAADESDGMVWATAVIGVYDNVCARLPANVREIADAGLAHYGRARVAAVMMELEEIRKKVGNERWCQTAKSSKKGVIP